MQTIIDYWQSRGVSSALNAMHMMNEPCVTMDVLSNTFAKNSRIEMLNYGHVAMLLPHAQQLTNSKYESHVLTGLATVQNILRHFAPQIIKLKTAPSMGVDLAREDRIKECDACVQQIAKFQASKGLKKALSRQG